MELYTYTYGGIKITGELKKQLSVITRNKEATQGNVVTLNSI